MKRLGRLLALALILTQLRIMPVTAVSAVVQPSTDGYLLTAISNSQVFNHSGFTYNITRSDDGFVYDNREESDTYSITDTTKTGCLASLQSTSLEALVHTQALYLEQTLCFDALPVNTSGEDVFSGGKLYGKGYTFFLSNRDDQAVMYEEKTLIASVQNAGNGELTLYIADSNAASDSGSAAIPLGVELGQTFCLGLQWNLDDSADVYVDGVYLKTVADATRVVKGQAGKGWYYGMKYGEITGDACFTVSDVAVYGGILAAAQTQVKLPVYKTSGVMAETWEYPVAFTSKGNSITGALDGRWDAENLYLQVQYTAASKLTLTIGNYSKTVTLTSGSTLLTVPWEDIGIQVLHNNQVVQLQAILADDSGNAAYLSPSCALLYLTERPGDFLYAYPDKINITSNFDITSTPGMMILDTETEIDEATSITDTENTIAYLCGKKDSDVIDHASRNILLQQTVCVEAMPQEPYSYQGMGGNGLIITMIDRLTKEDGTLDGTHCELMLASLGNTDSGLQLYVGESTRAISLGKGLQETFCLGIQWNMDDTVDVYVDGIFLETVDNATVFVPWSGTDELTYRYNSLTKDVKLTLSQVGISEGLSPANTGFLNQQVLEELVQAQNPGLDASRVTANLFLPESYTNILGETDMLTWTSSMPHVISDTGTVCRQQMQSHVVLIASTADKVVGSLRFVVPGLDSFTGTQINAAFSDTPITLDGVISEEGWTLNAQACSDGIQVLRLGAQWQQDTLYLAVDTPELSKLQLTLAGIELDLDAVSKATTDTLTELAISFETLEITPDEYGSQISGQAALDGKSYDFSVVLSSVDWFSTDNTDHRIDHDYSNKVNGSDSGVVQMGDGYYLYDHYGAHNYPLNVNSVYLVYPKDDPTQPTVEPLWPVDGTYYFQCDFLATAMPAYDGSVAGCDIRNSNYGVSWFIGGERENAGQDARADITLFGIYNNGDNLMFVVSGENDLTSFPLDKKVGDAFRIAVAVDKDGNLTVFIDNKPVKTVLGAEKKLSGMVSYAVDATVGIKLARNEQAASSVADNFDVYVTNAAFGLYYGESVLDSLDFDTIKGNNTDENAVTYALSLPTSFQNERFAPQLSLQWSSSDPDVISTDGTVTRPAKTGKQVVLTVTASNGSSKDFVVYVKGKNPSNQVMTVVGDYDPENTYAKITDVYQFTLDESNNSIVYNHGSVQRVNLVKLTDGDGVARLHPDLLKLYVSNNNSQYTRIKDFKLLHDGMNWYLYGFDTEARYVKVHCTHYNGAEADFIGPLTNMISAYYDESFGTAENFAKEESYTVFNQEGFHKTDYVWKIDPDGLEAQFLTAGNADVRFYLGSELLYHYYEDGYFYVRVPYVSANGSVQLTVKSGLANAYDISNKEYVYENVYGSREVRQPIAATGNRTAKTYQMSDGRLVGIDCHASGKYLVQQYSSDGGYSWTEYEAIEASENWIGGASGFIYDEKLDRLIFLGYDSTGEVTVTRLIYTDDCGATWHQLGELEFEGNCYVNGLCLDGADGDGPNVDYLIGMGGKRFNSDGKHVGLQAYVGYTRDGGLTWQCSEDILWVDTEGSTESGISENCLRQLSDGTVVMYARWQVEEADHFAVYYSHNFGVNWDTTPTPSQVYTVNTNPVFAEFGEKTLLTWSGNAALGGESYRRIPLSIAVSQDDQALQEFRHIQDLYSKYSLQGLDTATQNQCTNPHVSVCDDSLIIHWMNNFTAVLMLQVDDFEDYLYKTKGAYDSFEGRTAEYEGWATVYGQISVSQDHATQGSSAMRIAQGTALARSVPEVGHGRISMDVYLENADSNFSVELQAAFSNDRSANVVSLDVVNGVLGGVQLQTGWNRLEFDLALTDGQMNLRVNGTSAQITVDTDVAEYICFVYIKTRRDTQLYLDDFTVEDADGSAVYAASYKGVSYKNFQDACDLAQQHGDGTLKLLSNISIQQVAVPAGVTLDLNGWELAADAIVSYGNVIDSSAGKTGLLRSENVVLTKDNAQMPLFDGNGYRFFSYAVRTLGTKQNGELVRFGFCLEFDDEQAYTILGQGNTGANVQVELAWGSGSKTFAFSDDLLVVYGNTVQTLPGLTVALILNVTGTDTLATGSVISVTPSLHNDLGIGVIGDAMTYTVE